MKKLLFILKQLLPFTYISKYKTGNGEHKLTVWKQWFGKPFNIKTFNLLA